MNNEEISRYIHVEIMGYCDHDFQRQPDPKSVTPTGYCKKCDVHFFGEEDIPDYCSDDSPRRLLNEVVAKVAEPNSYSFYEDLLFKFVKPKDDGHAYNNGYLTYLMLNATAERIARACVEAHKLTAKPAA